MSAKADQASQYPKEFSLIKQIGKGSFSEVWLAKCNSNRKNVAVKVISKNFINESKKLYDLIKKEVGIHKQLIHKNISSFVKIVENDQNYFIMMEFIKGNTLFNVDNSMRKHGFPLIESDIRKYFNQLLSAINYLHNDLHIIHRDLKLDNVMIDVDDNAKIIDFGFSSFIDDHDDLKEARGSLRYAAPEIFLKQESTTAVDMWALGIILYYLFTGFFPFDSKYSASELASKILFGKVEYPDSIDYDARSLIKKLLRKNPNKRITCREAMKHSWVTDSANDSVLDSDLHQNMPINGKSNNIQSDTSSEYSGNSQITTPQNSPQDCKNIKISKSAGSINQAPSLSSNIFTHTDIGNSPSASEKKEIKSKNVKCSKSIYSENMLKTRQRFKQPKSPTMFRTTKPKKL